MNQSSLLASTYDASTHDQSASQVVFLLSGQGSQYHQMGRELYDGDPIFRRHMDAFDTVLREATGRSVLATMYGEGQRKDVPFQRTVNTHPALFMLQVSLARTLMEYGVRPDLLLGSSLGEYVATALSGAVDADAMLIALARSAEIVEKKLPEGAMLAVMGDEALYDDPAVRDRVALAGVSGPRHFVVSGNPDAIEAVNNHLKSKGVMTVLVPVTHAFHSPDMDRCQEEIARLFAELSWHQPTIPVVSCLTGKVMEKFTATHAAAIGRQTVQLKAAFQALVDRVDGPVQLIDVGPSGSMGTLARQAMGQMAERLESYAVLSPFADG
ncbi:MAG TPA: acyltransferase domain-containing protein, partial [Magnetovibrio sp.]